MASAKVYSADGNEGGSAQLNDEVFNVALNGGLVHQVAIALMNNRREGNAETKVRWQVRGGGKKPFAQKGTGRARQGSSREPHMRGGGTVFGPHKRSYRKKVPVRMRRQALCCMLSDRLRDDQLCVLEGLNFTGPKTRPLSELWEKVAPEGRNTLLVAPENNKDLVASARNMTRLTVRTAADVNALDVLAAKRVLVLKDAISVLEERLT